MSKPPKWITCPAECRFGRTDIPDNVFEEKKGIIDGCWGGPHWWECYTECETCKGVGRIDVRAKKEQL